VALFAHEAPAGEFFYRPDDLRRRPLDLFQANVSTEIFQVEQFFSLSLVDYLVQGNCLFLSLRKSLQFRQKEFFLSDWRNEFCLGQSKNSSSGRFILS
jgi:hypothetical protein